MNLILQLRSASQAHDIVLDDIDVIQFDCDILTVHNSKTKRWDNILTQHTGLTFTYFTEPGEQIEYASFCIVERSP